MIKLDGNNYNLSNVEKAYLGSDLVYQKANYAPYSCTALYHFDGNVVDETGNNTSTATYNQQVGKFDKATTMNGQFPFGEKTNSMIKTGSFTFEYWCRSTSTSDKGFRLTVTSSKSSATSFISSNDYVTNGLYPSTAYGVSGSQNVIYKPTTFDCTIWHHIAITFHQGVIYSFIDGKLSSTMNVRTDITDNLTGLGSNWQVTGNHIDELMCCNEAKYLADFTPPTRPYALRPTA